MQEPDSGTAGPAFEINEEKVRTHITDMPVEQFETFLTGRAFTKECDPKTRKRLVRTFIRQVFLFEKSRDRL